MTFTGSSAEGGDSVTALAYLIAGVEVFWPIILGAILYGTWSWVRR